MFRMFASLPVIPLPGRGEQQVQPIHIADLVDAIVALVELPERASRRIAMVGPHAVSLREFYGQLRKAMGINRSPCFLPMPMTLVFAASYLSRWLAAVPDTDALKMLERGNTASAGDIARILGHEPRRVVDFVPAEYADALAIQSKMRWLLPILRLSIAVVWLVTGLVSAGLFPVGASYALLARADVPASLMPLALYGAALLDIALGILTLLPRRSRWLWLTQAALILFYTLVISLKLPEFWLHPYGPVLKNVTLLAALWVLYEFEDRPWTT